MSDRLTRNYRDRVIGGVCSGLADHLKIDVTLVRIIFVVFAFFSGLGLLLYIILWIVMPKGEFGSGMYESDTFHKKEVNPLTEEERMKKRRRDGMVAGAILILFGLLLLAERMLPEIRFRDIWPVLIIAAGLLLVFSAFSKKNKGK